MNQMENPSTPPQYTQWFGTFNNNDDTDKLITGTLSAISNRLSQGPYGSALHKISFIDDCPSGADPSTIAIAHTGSVVEKGTYEVVICPQFWALPAKPVKGVIQDTQPSAIIHEVSHFADLPTEGAGWPHATVDWPFYSYTRTPAHQLVSVDRNKAATNASNYEYFIDDLQEYFF